MGPWNGPMLPVPTMVVLGSEKLLKIVNCATIKETEKTERDSCGGPNGIGGWPPTSTWIKGGVIWSCSPRELQDGHDS